MRRDKGFLPHNKHGIPEPNVEPNDDVGLDVVEIRDAGGQCYSILNVVDMASCYQQAYIVRDAEGHGVPSSQSCLEQFLNGWVRFMGYPKCITVTVEHTTEEHSVDI